MSLPQLPIATPAPPVIQHIWCSAAISKKMEDVFIGFIWSQVQSGQKVDEYVVYLSTLGGSPFSAIALYNFLKSISQKTTVYNMGTVSSAGVPFFLAFQQRIGVPGCSFMIHQTTIPTSTFPDELNAFELQTQKDNLVAIDKKTQAIIEKETRGRAKEPLGQARIKRLALKSVTFHDHQAQKHGFIDSIALPTMPASGVIYITDQSLATLPG